MQGQLIILALALVQAPFQSWKQLFKPHFLKLYFDNSHTDY